MPRWRESASSPARRNWHGQLNPSLHRASPNTLPPKRAETQRAIDPPRSSQKTLIEMSYAAQVQYDSLWTASTWASGEQRPARIAPAASLDAVLIDQLDLLIDSRDNAGASDAERDRLNRVTKILLEPFEESVLIFAFASWHHQGIAIT